MAERNDNKPSQLTVGLCIAAIVSLATVGAVTRAEVPFIAYAIIGGVLLGVADIRRLIGGGDK